MHRALFASLFLVTVIAVFVMALIPMRSPWFGSDAGQHMVALSTLTFLARCAVPGRPLAVILAMLALAVLIELAQLLPFVTRQADVGDALWSSAGVVLGAAGYWVAARLAALRSAMAPSREARIQRSAP